MQLIHYPVPARRRAPCSDPLSQTHTASIGKQILAAIRADHADSGASAATSSPPLMSCCSTRTAARFSSQTEASPIADGSSLASPLAGSSSGRPTSCRAERANDSAGATSDLWSLGAALYAAVEGRDPFERNGAVAVLTAISTADPDAPWRAGLLWPVIADCCVRIRICGWSPMRPNACWSGYRRLAWPRLVPCSSPSG